MSTRARIALIIDDCLEDRELFRQFLLLDQDCSYSIIEAELGQQGLDMWQQYQPDIVLLDDQLPDMTGLEILTQMQVRTRKNNFPVVFISGKENEALVIKAMKAGAQDYLVKSQVTLVGLHLAVHRAISALQLNQRLEHELLRNQKIQNELLECRRIEIELRDAQEKLRLALEVAHIETWDWDIQSGQIVCSENRQYLFSLKSGEFIASFERFADWLHPEDRDRVLAALKATLSNGENYDIEFRVVYPDGKIRWSHSQGKVYCDPNGQPLRMIIVDREITDQKSFKQAYQESEEFKKHLIESSIDCVQIVNSKGQLIFMNDNGMRLMEIDDFSAFRDCDWCDLWEGENRQKLVQALAVARSGKASTFQGYCPTIKGNPKWWEVSVSPIFNHYQQVEQILAVSRDISERELSEKALQASEEQSRNILESITDAFYALDSDWRFTYLNTQAERLLDRTSAELLGKIIWEEYQIAGSEFEKAFHRVASEKIASSLTAFYPDHQRWYEVHAYPAMDGITVYFRDVTELKRIESEREQLLQSEQSARAAAETANRLKDDFLAILSHELRAPLTPILAWAQLLQSRKFDQEKIAKALATIERNAKSQSKLVDDLLDIAKIISGKLNLDVVAVNLAFVIESALDDVKSAAVAKSIIIHAALSKTIQVSGDPTRLQQIVWNLLSNAIKFTFNHGQVDIRLERVGDQAQITVHDTGKGIDPHFLPHVFESFRQEDASTTRKHGGLGLGLAIVRTLVEAHGGTIFADSQGENKGALFVVQLPLLYTELEEMNKPTQAPKQGSQLTGLRILAVDDEPDTRELIESLLTQYGAIVMSVASVPEALACLETYKPDVLVSDIGMPGMDGYALVKAIRALAPEKGGQIPALALSAYARDVDSQRALANGFQKYVTKPIHVELFVQAVEELANPQNCT
jgi:PAS domain S-box-containing protein